MNIDPSKMSPDQMKEMLNTFSGMSDEEISNTMKMMGVNMDPKVVRTFINQMKGASEDELNKLKEQYQKGNVKMNEFKSPLVIKLETLLTEANTSFSGNKLTESIDQSNKLIEEIKSATIEDKDKEEVKALLEKAYDQLTLAWLTIQDYDTTIAECIKAVEECPLFSIYNRMGVCYFKKGRHTKARDAFNKAKELFPNETDTIADKYLKMALEEIENY